MTIKDKEIINRIWDKYFTNQPTTKRTNRVLQVLTEGEEKETVNQLITKLNGIKDKSTPEARKLRRQLRKFNYYISKQ